jgi:hypothetical protein
VASDGLSNGVYFYTHERFKDVFIEVLEVFSFGPEYVKLKVRWWNLGFTGHPWIVPIDKSRLTTTQDIAIRADDWAAHWSPFDPNDPTKHPGRRAAL